MRVRRVPRQKHPGGRPLREPVLVRALQHAGLRDLKDLANRIGVRPSTLRSLRADPSRVPAWIRPKLAEVLGIAIEHVDGIVFPRALPS